MRNLKRWMLAVLITFPAIAVASEKPDASSAEVAIAEAEAAVKQASTRRALWTSAEDALRRARRALQEGNAAMAIEQARIAQKQSELGIAQKDYPLFR
jgi:hypothetical protein